MKIEALHPSSGATDLPFGVPHRFPCGPRFGSWSGLNFYPPDELSLHSSAERRTAWGGGHRRRGAEELSRRSQGDPPRVWRTVLLRRVRDYRPGPGHDRDHRRAGFARSGSGTPGLWTSHPAWTARMDTPRLRTLIEKFEGGRWVGASLAAGAWGRISGTLGGGCTNLLPSFHGGLPPAAPLGGRDGYHPGPTQRLGIRNRPRGKGKVAEVAAGPSPPSSRDRPLGQGRLPTTDPPLPGLRPPPTTDYQPPTRTGSPATRQSGGWEPGSWWVPPRGALRFHPGGYREVDGSLYRPRRCPGSSIESRVLPARLTGAEALGGSAEVLLLRPCARGGEGRGARGAPPTPSLLWDGACATRRVRLKPGRKGGGGPRAVGGDPWTSTGDGGGWLRPGDPPPGGEEALAPATGARVPLPPLPGPPRRGAGTGSATRPLTPGPPCLGKAAPRAGLHSSPELLAAGGGLRGG